MSDFRVGLLAEAVFTTDRIYWWATCHRADWAEVFRQLNAKSSQFLAVLLRPRDGEAGYLVVASQPFECRPARSLARVYKQHGSKAFAVSAEKAAGLVMAAAHLGADLDCSPEWADLIIMK